MGMVREFVKTVSYCAPQKWLYIWGLGALLVVDAADVAGPYFLKWGLNAASPAPGHEPSALERWLPASWFGPDAAFGGMWVFAAAYLAIVLFACIFRYWMSMTFTVAAINVSHDLRNRFYDHVQRLPAAWHDHSTIGRVMSLSINDMDACRFFWGFGLLLFADAIFLFILTPVVMLTLSPKLVLMCLIPLPLIPLATWYLAKRIEDRFEEVQEQFEALSERAQESFAGARVVKSFAAEAREGERYAVLAEEYRKRALRLARVQSLQNPLLVVLLGVADFIIVAYGGLLVLNGELEAGTFVAFFFILLRLTGPMMGMGWVIAIYQRGAVSRRRIEEVLNVEPAVKDSPGAVDVVNAKGRIECRNLTFSYAPDTPTALTGVSLVIEPGKTIAIVGEVGSGKTTLLNLLPRLYDPPPGTVFIDGHDVREIKLAWLRRHVALVPQETFLFSDTIRENIAFGLTHTQPDMERIRQCARIARIEEDILSLPKQYDTLLGERGVNLSGGQKQRVAIARALACDPLILILDDCLSAVDTQTEESILEGLKHEAARRTCLIVSHRVSTVKHADCIYVLESGRVIESGTHNNLIGRGGWYADLARRQAIEAEIGQIRRAENTPAS